MSMGIDGEFYDDDPVIFLRQTMLKAGYCDKTKQLKTIKSIFEISVSEDDVLNTKVSLPVGELT